MNNSKSNQEIKNGDVLEAKLGQVCSLKINVKNLN